VDKSSAQNADERLRYVIIDASLWR